MASEQTRAQASPSPDAEVPGSLSRDEPSRKGEDERGENGTQLEDGDVDPDQGDDPAIKDLQERLDQFLVSLPEHIMFCRILSYFQRISKGFPVESERFGRFADLADDWQDGRIDLSGMIIRFTNLFRDKPEIVLGLNEFLPGRYHIYSDLSLELP